MITPQQIIARIGQLPIGDPSAIRSHAARVEADANEIASRSARVVNAVHGMGFQGPAADRWRHAMDGCDRDSRHAASDLSALAGRMRQVAARLEGQQAQWHRDFARVKARLEQIARDAVR